MDRQDLNTILAFVIPTISAFAVWLIQRRINQRTIATLKEKADLALERAAVVEERRTKLVDEHNATLKRIDALETRGMADSQSLAMLKQEMLPMAEAMKRKLVEILTHPSEEFVIPDKLLAEVKNGAPLPDELKVWLEERKESTNPHVTEQEKLAAEALPIIIRLAELEAIEAQHAPITAIQLVSSTAITVQDKKAQETADEEGTD